MKIPDKFDSKHIDKVSLCKVKIGGFESRTKCIEDIPADVEISEDNSSLDIYPYNPIPSNKDSYAIVFNKIFNPKKAGLKQFHSYGQYALQNSSSISADLLSVNLGFRFKKIDWFNSLTLGTDQVSGDDLGTEKMEGFSKYFGARHKHHGYYDYKMHKKYFGHNHEGLKEYNLKGKFNFFKNPNLLIAYHDFSSNIDNIKYGQELVDEGLLDATVFKKNIDTYLKRSYRKESAVADKNTIALNNRPVSYTHLTLPTSDLV